MKKLTSIAIAFLLVLSVVPAMAGDQTDSQATVSFQALSNLSTTESQALTPLTDTELAAIEGGVRIDDICVVCINFANQVVTQVAVPIAVAVGDSATAAAAAVQSSEASIRQSIN